MRIRVDRFTLGDIAEETGMSIVVTALDSAFIKKVLVGTVTVLCGNRAKLEFYSPLESRDGVVPPPFDSLGEVKHE